jgi:hypothetical protein
MGMNYAMPALPNVALPYPGAVDIETNDLVFLCPSYPAMAGLTANNAYPAASMVDQGDSWKNQRLFAHNFAGVSVERHLATSSSSNDELNLSVCPVWIGDASLASAAVCTIGQLVGVAENVGNNGLQSQTLAIVTDPDLAIGQVIQDSGGNSVSTIRVALYSRLFGPMAKGDDRNGVLVEAVAVTGFTDDGGSSGHYDTVGKLPPGAVVTAWGFACTGAFAGDTTATLEVGTAASAAAYSAVTTGSVFTTGQIGSASVAASSFVSAEGSARITVTSSTDFTLLKTNAGGAGILILRYQIVTP